MIHSSVGGDLKSTTSKYGGVWPPSETTSGNGVSVQGKIVDFRNHSVQDSSNKQNRYMAVVVDVEFIRKRTFNEQGEETEPGGPNEKAVAKGYINKFDHKDIEDKEKITSDTFLQTVLHGKSLPYFLDQEKNLHPNISNRFEFWGTSTLLKPMDLKKNDTFRLKTKGNSIIIESCSPLKPISSNYSGQDVLGGWTSKISSPVQSNKPLPGQDKEGVDDSEWD